MCIAVMSPAEFWYLCAAEVEVADFHNVCQCSCMAHEECVGVQVFLQQARAPFIASTPAASFCRCVPSVSLCTDAIKVHLFGLFAIACAPFSFRTQVLRPLTF